MLDLVCKVCKAENISTIFKRREPQIITFKTRARDRGGLERGRGKGVYVFEDVVMRGKVDGCMGECE